MSSAKLKADVAVVGGSVTGLATAMFYAQKGAQVIVIDPDPAETSDPPVVPWEHPHRRSTPQDRHSHVLLARGYRILQTRAPDLLEKLRAAGAIEQRLPGADELVGVMCRRTLLDRVICSHAREVPGVQLRDEPVTGLVLDRAQHRVRGVATTTTSIDADLVVDAAGRRSPLRRWLAEQNVATPDAIRVPCGTVYLTAFYRLRHWPSLPLNRGYAAGGFGPACACLAFPTDNGFMSVTIGVLPGDPLVRPLLDRDTFTGVAQLHPLVEPWLDPANIEPCGDVAVMSGLQNQLLPPPELDGLVAVGDAACTTNPAYGRGMSLALVHAATVADFIAPGSGYTAALAHAVLDRELRGWFDDSAAQDELRTARWFGHDLPDDPMALIVEAAARRAPHEPDVHRALLRRFNLIDPPEAIAAIQPAPNRDRAQPAWTPGPTRAELVEAVSHTASGGVRAVRQVA